MSEQEQTRDERGALSDEWMRRVTALPTQADIERCKELWPKNWQDQPAFHAGQVATLLDAYDRQRAELEAALKIVRVVADCDNSHDVACLQFCQVRELSYHGADEKWFEHIGPCVFEQARALLVRIDRLDNGVESGNPCPVCDGSGVITVSSLVLLGDGNVKTETHPCEACERRRNGDG